MMEKHIDSFTEDRKMIDLEVCVLRKSVRVIQRVRDMILVDSIHYADQRSLSDGRTSTEGKVSRRQKQRRLSRLRVRL